MSTGSIQLPKKTDLIVENNVKIDVQLTVDNIADLPAGQFEDSLDLLREDLQSQQSKLSATRAQFEKELKKITEEQAAGYQSDLGQELAASLGKFFDTKYAVLVEAAMVDMERSVLVLDVFVLAEKDKTRYLEKGKSESRESYYGYSDFPEVTRKFDLPFSDGLTVLKGQLEDITAQLKVVTEKLSQVSLAYGKIPKLRDRAKRRMTEAALRGDIVTSDDVLKFISTVAPDELKKLPAPSDNG